MTPREKGGLDVKFNTYGGGTTFSFLFANWKSSGKVIRVQISILTLNKTDKFMNAKVF